VTRREQYLERQRRYKRRAEQMYRRGHAYLYLPPSLGHPNGQHLRNGRSTPLWTSGVKQLPDKVKRGPSPDDPVFPFVEGTHFTVSAPSYRVPTIVKWVGFMAASFAAMLPSKQRTSLARHHCRRVNYVGHKPDRMNGFQRSCWGAAYHAYSDGWFPAWDPLQRRPNEADFIGGWIYSGPFPQTPPA